MKLSTEIKKEEIRRKICDITVDFASKYHECTAEEITTEFFKFNDKLKKILRIKI